MSFAAITTLALCLSSAINLLALLVWVRLLSPAQFGLYALASAAALLIHAVCFEWLRVLAARTLYDPNGAGGIGEARAGALIRLGLGIALGLVLLAGGAIVADVGLPGVPAAWMPLVVAFALSEMVLSFVNVVSRVKLSAWPFFVAVVVRSTLVLTLGSAAVLLFDGGAKGVLVAIVVAQAAAALVVVARDDTWATLLRQAGCSSDRAGLREIVGMGAPLILSTALAYLATVADRFILEAALGTAAVGLYVPANDLLQKTLGFAFLALNISGYPAIVRAYEDRGAQAASRLLERNFVLQLAIAVPAVLTLAIMAPGLAALLLGPALADEGAWLLPWLAFAALLRLLANYHLALVFQLERRMTAMLVAPAVLLAVLVPTGIGMTGHMGVGGMAIASVIAAATSYAASFLCARRLMPIRFATADTVRVFAASAALVAVLLPLSPVRAPGEVLAACGLGGAVYLAMLLALRPERLRSVRGMVRAKNRFR